MPASRQRLSAHGVMKRTLPKGPYCGLRLVGQSYKLDIVSCCSELAAAKGKEEAALKLISRGRTLPVLNASVGVAYYIRYIQAAAPPAPHHHQFEQPPGHTLTRMVICHCITSNRTGPW